DNPVLRADVWPLVRRGFAAIVKARPDEAAREPRPRIAEAPPAFSRGTARGGVGIVGTYITFAEIGHVNSARTDRTYGFSADDRLLRMGLVIGFRAWVHVVVAHHVALYQGADTNCADGSDRHWPRTI